MVSCLAACKHPSACQGLRGSLAPEPSLVPSETRREEISSTADSADSAHRVSYPLAQRSFGIPCWACSPCGAGVHPPARAPPGAARAPPGAARGSDSPRPSRTAPRDPVRTRSSPRSRATRLRRRVTIHVSLLRACYRAKTLGGRGGAAACAAHRRKAQGVRTRDAPRFSSLCWGRMLVMKFDWAIPGPHKPDRTPLVEPSCWECGLVQWLAL